MYISVDDKVEIKIDGEELITLSMEDGYKLYKELARFFIVVKGCPAPVYRIKYKG